MKPAHLVIFSLLILTTCALPQNQTSESEFVVTDEATLNMSKIQAACIFLAAQTYEISPAVLLGIYAVKKGEEGQEYGPLPDGSYGLGLMKINTSKLPELAKQWEADEEKVRQWIKDDSCTNMGVAGYVFRSKLDETDDLAEAIALYNEGTAEKNEAFKEAVINAMRQHGLGKGIADKGTL